MRMRTSTRAALAVLTATVLVVSAGRAAAQGCCGVGGAHAGHGAAAHAPAGRLSPLLASYDKIHASLADDSLSGVADAAGTLAKLAAGDPTKALPADIAAQAGALAQAQDLVAAREGFKRLSASLIGFLEGRKIGTGYLVVYCDMARASWLQKDPTVRNPYFGKSMSRCGEVKKAI